MRSGAHPYMGPHHCNFNHHDFISYCASSGEIDFRPLRSTEGNTILLTNLCSALILFDTGLLIHSTTQPVRQSHMDTFVRSSLSRHTSCLYVDWFRPASGSLGPDQFVQGRSTPFFIVKSYTSDKLPKLNWVGMPELQRSFTFDLLACTFWSTLTSFHSNPSTCLIFNKVFNYDH